MRVVRGINSRGFTLLELLVAMAVAAVLLGIAVPSYRGIVQRNTVSASANDLVGALNYARSQAVTRGESVYLCGRRRDQPLACAAKGGWNQGWIVYAPAPGKTKPTTDNLLRVRGPLNNQVSVTGDDHTESTVSFDANGFATNNNGTLTVSAASAPDRYVVIAPSGRIRTDDKPPS